MVEPVLVGYVLCYLTQTLDNSLVKTCASPFVNVPNDMVYLKNIRGPIEVPLVEWLSTLRRILLKATSVGSRHDNLEKSHQVIRLCHRNQPTGFP